MRLEKIKLAGFKSFVDPTVVHLPSNRVAVVGPNGCGKSNVIDAVRWVMGESSARMLRGESMADVIFNGSSARKPVGAATIELLFDNGDGGAGGQYASYAQISVKRQVTRDGQSNYFLNGTRCRRRDITDLFLGTGLGPRSYSIIEQGTISRLIEARPEELRQFLEEAAGISRYKERRRETESRMQHTRENLDRLNDLREEVGKHLHHLERQAATAERYRQLCQDERRLKAEWLALRWRALSLESRAGERAQAALDNAVEAALARQRHLEARLEELRARTHEAGEGFSQAQGQYYAVGAELARLEQALQFSREGRRRQERELAELEQALTATTEQLRQDQAEATRLERSLTHLAPALAEAREEEEAREAQLDEAEEAMHQWQTTWEAFNRDAAAPAQAAQVERTRMTHLEQQCQQLERRLARLTEELQRLEHPQLDQELEELALREQEWLEQLAEQRERLVAHDRRIQTLRGALAEINVHLDEAKEAAQTARGRRASLETLQQAALKGGASPALETWLKAQGLRDAARLGAHLEVAGPWQTAVERVLGPALQALCVPTLDPHGAALEALGQGPLTLFETGQEENAAPATEARDLLGQVRAPWPLAGLLAGVGLAEDLTQALARRRALAPGQSLVTPGGTWVGPDWISLPGAAPPGAGVLARAQELKALGPRLAELETQVAELGADLLAQRQALEAEETDRRATQGNLDQYQRTLGQVRAELSAQRARAEHWRQRQAAVDAERAELEEQLIEERESLALARERLHVALAEMETLAEHREILVAERDDRRSVLTRAREAARASAARAHHLALELEAGRAARASLDQGMGRLGAQLTQAQARREALVQAVAAAEAPLQTLEEHLQEQLRARLAAEQALTQARERLEQLEREVRETDQERLRAEQEAQRQRLALDQARAQGQELVVRCRTLEEQLKESGQTAEDWLATLPEGAAEDPWQSQLETLQGRIQRLGPINLAAIDEFREQAERKRYLDAQHEDISRALETLEEAIRKIDRETRTRFKDIFEQVNAGLGALFPRLFGGGHAYLELTGEDLLDTGVTVMARPPGKRNSSIHLLSGGEKALTAVALVFAIFQLNPAPFCMLDEVDAPLDDANVGRFCELVKSLSDQVQFIFITHNKVTMELANQLIGVTMHEPGVSRLVSVDVEAAARLAAV